MTMNPMVPMHRAAMMLCLVAVGAGCMHADASGPLSGPASSPASTAAADDGAAALAQIDSMIGAARCTADDQCRVAGVGSHACGGPESYRAWSTAATLAPKLEQRLQAYAQQRQRWRDKVGLMSTCDLQPAPSARCDRVGTEPGRCVLVPAGGGLR